MAHFTTHLGALLAHCSGGLCVAHFWHILCVAHYVHGAAFTWLPVHYHTLWARGPVRAPWPMVGLWPRAHFEAKTACGARYVAHFEWRTSSLCGALCVVHLFVALCVARFVWRTI